MNLERVLCPGMGDADDVPGVPRGHREGGRAEVGGRVDAVAREDS